jgi:indolepyruvate ferredoxin oxidoreductase alpha subunit
VKRLLLGNEALALGARAAGVTIATGYPGTPSTEIMEYFARYPGVQAHWSPNEKVALEVAIGASLAGARTIVTMKHVGLNVAADPFFAAAYTGVNGGLVVITADDPGMHSSQGEQDNRNYARFAKVPLLEPSDSQECFDMVATALQISEEFDIPVLLRTTGRISHAQSVVDVDAALFDPAPPNEDRARTFQRAPSKYVMLPANARTQRVDLEERLRRLRHYAETTPLNQVLWQDRRLGIVSSSIAYQYAREVFPDASFLKLGMAYPFPASLVLEFARQVDTLLVVEELDPFLEEHIRALPGLPDIPIHGRDLFPGIGELSVEVVAGAARAHGLLPTTEAVSAPAKAASAPPLPPRPPVLCAGCPHRAAFYVLGRLNAPREADGEGRRERVIVTGDIGCYTLGALPPLGAMDTCLCMGASIGMALGMEQAGYGHKVVAVIGDGTFYHSGITGLVDVVTSGAATTVVIMDNGTTAMTGGNPNPGTGATITGAPAARIELETLCRALGVNDVSVLDAYDTDAIRQELERSLRTAEPTVLIVRAPCRLQVRERSEQVAWVDPEKCVGCELCLRAGCPALTRAGEQVEVLPALCTGCNLCGQICPQDAILLVPREEGRA